MNELMTIMNSAEFGEVRTVLRDGEPWFVAKDVCDAFGETNRNRAMQRLDDDEKGYTRMTTPGGEQQVAIVSESGLYALLFAMQPEEARGVSDEYIRERQEKLRAFKRWITHDVLPTLRKQGYYSMIKDEDLLKVIESKRRMDNNYLRDGMEEINKKLTAERWDKMREIWPGRFDRDHDETERLIEEIWAGDEKGYEKARRHYFSLVCSKRGWYERTPWKEPSNKCPACSEWGSVTSLLEIRKQANEWAELARELAKIDYRHDSGIQQLDKMNAAIIHHYNKWKTLEKENEMLVAENMRLKSMVNAAVN